MRPRGETPSGAPGAEDRGRQLASILIVDDRPGNLLSLRSILEPLGQKIVHANSGDEALRQVLGNDFAVILMDVRMPGLDGMKTAQLIRRRPRAAHVPIIFLTAVSIESAEIIRAYELGAVDFIFKPFEPAILRSKVKVFVELHLKEEMIKRQAALLMERDRKAVERRNLTRFRSVLDSMPIAVMALRPDGTVYYWNETVSDWVRTPLTDRNDASPLEIVCPEDRERVGAAWSESLRQGKPLETQFRMQRKSDGALRWYLCRIVPQRDEDGAIGSWICTATDIDRHYEAREEAESANRMKDEFLATVSHELRNPLSAILGWARLLRSGKLGPEKTAHAMEIIERNARSQAALVDEMLDIARITRGKLHLDFLPVDFAQVTQAALAGARPLADAKEIALDCTAEGGAALEVIGDADRLQQVVANLLSNAIKFTHNGGRVRIGLRRGAGAIELTVADNGQGIRGDFLPFVFERFRQAQSGATRVYAGLGIGLSLSREIVELHGGTIRAESGGEGCGATFTVSLPCRRAPAANGIGAGGAATGAQPSLNGIKVLVVDDEADSRELLAEVLAEFGAETLLAGSVEEALNAIAAKPNVIISDIGMPLEDGYSLIRRLRRLPPAEGGLIPAGALTGWATPQEARRALAAGFQLHITKPVEAERLVAAVHDLANRDYPALKRAALSEAARDRQS